MRTFTDTEVQILRHVQGTLPDSATPFADVADVVSTELGIAVSEEDVLTLLQSMKEEGAIRRFGATLRHQKAGYGANSMVAWIMENPDSIPELGEKISQWPSVSHCYFRKAQPGWPYTLYTMVHGKSQDDCLNTVQKIRQEFGLDEYAVLFSIKELKKTSMVYF